MADGSPAVDRLAVLVAADKERRANSTELSGELRGFTVMEAEEILALVAERDALQERAETAEMQAAENAMAAIALIAERDSARRERERAVSALKWIGTAYESPPQQTVASIAAFAREVLRELGESKP